MAESLDSLVLGFVEFCELERGLSHRTAEKYHYRLDRFIVWLSSDIDRERSLLRITDVTEDSIKGFRLHLNKYISEQTKKSLATSTQQHYLVALRAFLKYLKRRKKDMPVVAEDILLPKAHSQSVSFLTEEQLEALFSMPDVRDVNGLRDRTILELLFSTGLRVQELVNLNVDQIPKKDTKMSVLGKGGRHRLVFLSPRSKEWLDLYIGRRMDTWKPLFLNAKGFRGGKYVDVKGKNSARRSKGSRSYESDLSSMNDPDGEQFRLTVRSIQRMIKKYALQAGISQKVTPHVMRHSFATDLLSAGADLRSVQELLGHKNVATTQIYTHVTNRQLEDVHKRFHSQVGKNTGE